MEAERLADRPSHPETTDTQTEYAELLGFLRLVGTLGLTVVFAVTAGFLGGLWIGRRYSLGVFPVIAGTALGVAASFLWAYRRLTSHLASVSRSDVVGGPQDKGSEPPRNG